jgi:putative FmdB family regulatory protein
MPVHDYKCATCAAKREVFLKIADLGSTVHCQRCGQPMLRQVSAPYVRGDYLGYECPVTGKWVEGRRAHEENLRVTGCRLLEPGESDAYRRKCQEDEQKLDKSLEETADRFIAELPTEKRDRLAAEMEGGLTTTIERSTPKFN